MQYMLAEKDCLQHSVKVQWRKQMLTRENLKLCGTEINLGITRKVENERGWLAEMEQVGVVWRLALHGLWTFVAAAIKVLDI